MLTVQLKTKRYPIYIERGIIDKLGYEMKNIFYGKKVAIITDENVNRYYGERLSKGLEEVGIEVITKIVPPGEKSKSFNTLVDIYNFLAQAGVTRSDLIITFGGGVVGDLGGFAAATYMRGIQYVQIPTSLLSQIDSSIGGKVAVNLEKGKNLVGSFYHPEAVYIDPDLLKSLDKKFLHDGIAEVIKYGCIRDKKLFDNLLTYQNDDEILAHMDYIIESCCSIKKSIVEKDENDRGERVLLNFGHTFGHAIEQYFNYERYTHGEAVAAGMYWITAGSERLGLTKPGTLKSIKYILDKYGLPSKIDIASPMKLLDCIRNDKKNMGASFNLVILKEIGEGAIYKSSIESIKDNFLLANC